MSWPTWLQGKSVRLESQPVDAYGFPCFLEMSFDGSLKGTGKYQGDYCGTTRHIASGAGPKGGYWVIFEWEDAFGGQKGIQTMCFENENLSGCRGSYFYFEHPEDESRGILHSGNMRDYKDSEAAHVLPG